MPPQGRVEELTDIVQASEMVNLAKKGRGRPKLIQSLSVLYPHGRSVSAAKFADIQSLLKYIPPMHHVFYNNIPHEQRSVLGPETGDDIIENYSDGLSDC